MNQLVRVTILSMSAWLALLCECGAYLSEVEFLPGLSNASLLSSEAPLHSPNISFSITVSL